VQERVQYFMSKNVLEYQVTTRNETDFQLSENRQKPRKYCSSGWKKTSHPLRLQQMLAVD